MKLNSKVLGIIVLVVIFGGIALSSALGYWNTDSSGGGGYGGETGETAEEAESIRGKTTFQDLLNLGLSQDTIEQVIGGPMPEPLTRVNAYCQAQGLDFETVKEDLQAELDRLNE